MTRRTRRQWPSTSQTKERNVRPYTNSAAPQNPIPIRPESDVLSEPDLSLLTVVEAAKVLRISRNLAYELVARGEIPSVRLGRIIRVPRSALDAIVRDASVHKRAS